MLWKKKRKEPENEFINDLKETESFKTMLKTQRCPGCSQLTLVLRSFERGPQGFEAQVSCSNCQTLNGVVNALGFHFVGLTKGAGKPFPIRAE